MGQTSSTQRDQRHEDTAQFSLLPREHDDGDEGGVNNEDMAEHTEGRNSPPLSVGDEMDADTIHDSASEQPVSSHSDTWQTSAISAAGPAESEPTRAYEQQSRPVLDVGFPENRASLARMTVRRQSTMSRLGSRILPNSVIRGLLNSEEETPAEGHAHRNGILSRSMLTRSEGTASRFTSFSPLGSRGITRRRSIRGPYPLPRGDAALMPDSPPNPTYLDPSIEQIADPVRGSWRRSARLSRVRNSLSTPISQIFGQPSPPPSSQSPGTPPRRLSLPEASDHFLPSLGSMDTRMDYDDTPHELDSVEPAARNPRPVSPMSSSRSSQSVNGIRRFPGVLRTRSSRVLRRDEQTPLSRVLQLAAAAIAAQLSGAAAPALPNIQSLGNGGPNGSLENFIQSLQHVTSAHTNPSGADGAQDPAADGNSPPVNFLRVFRFVNSENHANSTTSERSTSQSEEQDSRSDRMDIDEPPRGGGTDGRTVTLVVVGVRSVPSINVIGRDQHGDARPGLDTLLGLPLIPPSNVLRNQASSGDLPQRADAPSGSSPRRLSVGGTNPLTASDSQSEGASSTSRRPSDAGPSSGLSSSSDSPPGPHPPPSTPAEQGLSAVSSGATTPSRRPSSASAISPGIPSQPSDDSSRQPEPAEENTPPNTARQRRRSDSESARHRDLGSGAARRNGVVEPDNAPPSGGRSWLIYVVGTNLSENHPAFAAPSLFTDNPTYEDMLLLSSLLGPAKPPVASQEDVSAAGGLFRLVEYAGSLVAEALDGTETIQIPENERCLICLSDYEAAEEVRRLAKCKHLYHKACIDEVCLGLPREHVCGRIANITLQWLTTGRNSCPLCRGQGVAESSNNSNSNQTQAAAA